MNLCSNLNLKSVESDIAVKTEDSRSAKKDIKSEKEDH